MYSLKVYLLGLVLGVTVISAQKKAEQQMVKLDPDQFSKLFQIVLECATENSLDPSIIDQIRTRKYKDDDNTKSFFFCGFKKTGITNKKGEIRSEKMLAIYPQKANKEALKKVIEDCNKPTGEPKDNTFRFFKCFQENTPVRLTLN